MHDRGIARGDLATKANLSEATLSRYLNGERLNPRVEELSSLARSLNVTLSWLWEGVGPRERGAGVEPELAGFEWPTGTPEVVRLDVQQQVLRERAAHRLALVPYWIGRMTSILDAELRRLRDT